MNTSMSYAVFLEPRGILKILQFVFVICAFACTCDFRGSVVLKALCNDNAASMNITDTTEMADLTAPPSPVRGLSLLYRLLRGDNDAAFVSKSFADDGDVENGVKFVANFKYPFNLDKSSDTQMDCAKNDTKSTMRLYGNYSSTASFYVFVGVFGMLFTLFAIVIYVFFQPTYEFMEWIPIADTVMHGIFTLMWFGSSIAWATALTEIKKHTKTDFVLDHNPSICDVDYQECSSVPKIEYQLLDFSVIFGFLNVVLYGGNVWFVFKETKYFKKPVAS